VPTKIEAFLSGLRINRRYTHHFSDKALKRIEVIPKGSVYPYRLTMHMESNLGIGHFLNILENPELQSHNATHVF